MLFCGQFVRFFSSLLCLVFVFLLVGSLAHAPGVDQDGGAQGLRVLQGVAARQETTETE